MQSYNNPDPSTWSEILQRPTLDTRGLEKSVATILGAIRSEGDTAVRRYSEQFDGVAPAKLRVSAAEMAAAKDQVSTPLQNAIRQAASNIEQFHIRQRETPQVVETMPGVQCWRRSVGIEKVGLYIPGGTAPLFSTVLMLGVPARLASCETIVLCTPPRKDGSIDPAILFAAEVVGIKEVYKIGGVQAIGAMAYGTESVPAVYKIFGPGNQYVTAAKQQVNREDVAIDLPAGPSEVMVVADDTAVPAFVAADLLSQAEHGGDSQVVLVAFSADFINQVQQALAEQLATLPRREITAKALENSVVIQMKEREVALDLINAYAPEHLILAIEEAGLLAQRIRNAGSVFIGNYTPESAGDYASGTNHTLPTNGYARAYSGVSLDSFTKKITFQEITPNGLQKLGPIVEVMAEAEQLVAHQRAVSLRLEYLEKEVQPSETNVDQVPKAAVETLPHINYLLRENIRNLNAYSSARDEFDGSAEVYLDANENPFPGSLNRYPDPLQKEVKRAISATKGVEEEAIFLGNGSDEAIDLLIRIFCEPRRDAIMTLPPTYGMYQVSANTADVAIKKVPLDADFQPNIPAILSLSEASTKLLFLCNPNNPTGSVIPRADIIRIIRSYPGIVVVDEAYADFSSEESSLSLLKEFDNLVVLQTFSKAWGMAGARLGMAFAHPFIIKMLNRVKPPYNVNQLTQNVALDVLSRSEAIAEGIQQIIAERTQLEQALKQLSFVEKVFPSQTNFLLVRVAEAKKLYQYLLKKSIIVRNRSTQPGCENCLRMTVGTPLENRRLIEALHVFQNTINSSVSISQ